MKFLTGSKLIYLLKIVKISSRSEPIPYGRAMEEFAELQVECSKMARGQKRDKEFLEEISDAFFYILKLLFKHRLTLDSLIDYCILKTVKKFPEQIKEVNNGF